MADVASSRVCEDLQGGGLYFGFVEFEVGHADLTAAATTEALDITGIPANIIPLRAERKITAYFTGGGATTCTFAIGDADPDALLDEVNVFDTTDLDVWAGGTQGVEWEYGATGPTLEAAYAGKATFVCSGNVSILTTGALIARIYYKRYDSSKAAA